MGTLHTIHFYQTSLSLSLSFPISIRKPTKNKQNKNRELLLLLLLVASYHLCSKSKMTTSDERSRKRCRCLAYIVAGVIAQTIIIVLFVLLIMRIRNPKVRFGFVEVQNLSVNSSSSAPSFTLKLNAQVTVKNTNFGHFKFDNTTATIYYRGSDVGEGTIIKARARARSTKKFNVTVPVSSNKVSSSSSKISQLASDIKSEVLHLSSHAKLSGKIHLFKIFKKKKSAELNCNFDVNTKTKAIANLTCK